MIEKTGWMRVTLPTRLIQTLFGAALLIRVIVQTVVYHAAGGDEPTPDYQPRTAPAVDVGEDSSMRLLVQLSSAGIGSLLMAYILAPGFLEAPLLRVGQWVWIAQAGALIALPVADNVRWLGRDRT